MTTEEKITGKMELNEVGEVAQTPHELAQTDEVRRGKKNEWLLIGRDKKSGVPIWRFDWDMFQLNDKYPPQKLRALRKERGVGSSKKRKLLTTT